MPDKILSSFVATIVGRGIRARPGLAVGFILAMATGSASAALLALALGRAAGDFLGLTPPTAVPSVLLAALAALLLRAATQIATSLLSATISEHFTKTAHESVLTHILRTYNGQGAEEPTDIVGSTQELLGRLRWGVLANGTQTLGSGIVATALATIAMVMATRVAMLALALAAVLAIVVAVLSSRNRNSITRLGVAQVEAGRRLRERVELAREGRALGALTVLTSQAISSHDAASSARLAHAKVMAMHGGVLELVGAVAMAAFALGMAPRGSGAALASALAALVLLVRPAQSLASGLQQLIASIAEVERLAEVVLAAPRERAEPSTTDSSLGLVIAGLSLRYGSRTVLDDVALTVRPGEMVAILGPSGSGKSSLLELAVGARSADAGAVHVDGCQVLPRANIRALGLAWSPQRPSFLSESLSVNVDPADASTVEARRAALVEAGLSSLLARMTLSGLVPRAGAQLSQGERARLALARVLVTQPRYMVLDEPTASLDDDTEHGVMTMLRAKAREGAGLLVATHRASTAAHADRRFRVRDAKLEEID